MAAVVLATARARLRAEARRLTRPAFHEAARRHHMDSQAHPAATHPVMHHRMTTGIPRVTIVGDRRQPATINRRGPTRLVTTTGVAPPLLPVITAMTGARHRQGAMIDVMMMTAALGEGMAARPRRHQQEGTATMAAAPAAAVATADRRHLRLTAATAAISRRHRRTTTVARQQHQHRTTIVAGTGRVIETMDVAVTQLPAMVNPLLVVAGLAAGHASGRTATLQHLRPATPDHTTVRHRDTRRLRRVQHHLLHQQQAGMEVTVQRLHRRPTVTILRRRTVAAGMASNNSSRHLEATATGHQHQRRHQVAMAGDEVLAEAAPDTTPVRRLLEVTGDEHDARELLVRVRTLPPAPPSPRRPNSWFPTATRRRGPFLVPGFAG